MADTSTTKAPEHKPATAPAPRAATGGDTGTAVLRDMLGPSQKEKLESMRTMAEEHNKRMGEIAAAGPDPYLPTRLPENPEEAEKDEDNKSSVRSVMYRAKQSSEMADAPEAKISVNRPYSNGPQVYDVKPEELEKAREKIQKDDKPDANK